VSETERLIERARLSIAAFSAGDFDAAEAYIDPEIEWHVAFRLPDLPAGREVCRGPEEVRELWQVFTSVWGELALEIEEFVHADAEKQLLRVRFVGRGAVSGVEVDRVLFLAYRFRDGKLAYSRSWEDEDEARHDLGLSHG
jgi:ketosteroid isomerase-like protein